jgi:hypothetical protein
MDYEREPDPDLASELRQGVGREIVDEAAEDERMTEAHRRRQLTLADQAREMVNRGDRVSVEFGGHSFSGAVAAAGSDYVTIDGPGQVADIRLEMSRWSVLPLDRPGEPHAAVAESFRALLEEYSSSGRTVRLALPAGDMVLGALAVIASDHVEVDDVDQRRLIVPLNLILAVVRSSEAH